MIAATPRPRPTVWSYVSVAFVGIGCGWFVSWLIDGPWDWTTLLGCALCSVAFHAWRFDREEPEQ